MGPVRRAVALTTALSAFLLSAATAGADHDTYGTAEYGSGAGLESFSLAPPLALGPQGTATADPAAAPAGDGDFRSPNFHKLDRKPIEIGNGEKAQGSDLAFEGRLLVAGTYQGTGFFRITQGGVRQLSFHDCPGSQGDVSVLGDYVFVSIDTPSSNNKQSATCNNTATNLGPTSLNKEGIRIVDISNVDNPRQVAFLETECGSHTHTLIPGTQTSHMYVQSYPLTQQDNCTEANHPEGEISVIRFPTAAPQNAEVTGVIDILPPTVTPDAVGCHDIGVLPAKDLAAAACLGAFAILDISDPGNPRTLSVVQNPLIELDHSAQLTFDGDVAVIGDEHAGAAGGGGCSTDQRSPVGAMWFYDITDPASPQLQGSYSLPRVPPVDSAEEAERFRCTTHNYEILPMRDGRDVAVSPYYSGGLSIVDFTDPAAPEEQGYYLPQVGGKNPDMWSGYWYRGRTYTNEHASKLGISVFKTDGFGTRQVRDFGRRLNPQTQILP
jgi:hypothetical protein